MKNSPENKIHVREMMVYAPKSLKLLRRQDPAYFRIAQELFF